MKAIELGKISLEDDINEILPFKVINPYHNNIPITIRQLVNHTSSINDGGNYNKVYIFD
jgi:CubicO group peptidase (beta-lactamase class C family)